MEGKLERRNKRAIAQPIPEETGAMPPSLVVVVFQSSLKQKQAFILEFIVTSPIKKDLMTGNPLQKNDAFIFSY